MASARGTRPRSQKHQTRGTRSSSLLRIRGPTAGDLNLYCGNDIVAPKRGVRFRKFSCGNRVGWNPIIRFTSVLCRGERGENTAAETCAILTTTPNALASAVHGRMPSHPAARNICPPQARRCIVPATKYHEVPALGKKTSSSRKSVLRAWT